MTDEASCKVCEAPLESLLLIIRDCIAAIKVQDKILPSPYKAKFFSMDFSNWIRANIIQGKSLVMDKDISWDLIFA